MVANGIETAESKWKYRLAAYIGLGCLLGITVFQFLDSGFLVKWEPFEFPVFDRDAGFIDFDFGWDSRKPCERTWPAFSPFSNTPSEITSCTQFEGVDKDFSDKYLLAIDEDNNYWHWSNKRHIPTSNRALFVFLGGGGFTGLIIGGLMLIIRRK